MGCEGGQHDDPGSVDNLEAVLLLLGAESAGIFGAGTILETSAAHQLCERRRGELPHILEILSRRAISKDDEFVMEPGFANLAAVRAGRLLARDKNGENPRPEETASSSCRSTKVRAQRASSGVASSRRRGSASPPRSAT